MNRSPASARSHGRWGRARRGRGYGAPQSDIKLADPADLHCLVEIRSRDDYSARIRWKVQTSSDPSTPKQVQLCCTGPAASMSHTERFFGGVGRELWDPSLDPFTALFLNRPETKSTTKISGPFVKVFTTMEYVLYPCRTTLSLENQGSPSFEYPQLGMVGLVGSIPCPVLYGKGYSSEQI